MLHCTVYTLCINLGINSVACLSLRGDEWDDFYFCTGTACRTRAIVGLAKQFGTPLQALQYFQKPIEDRPEKPSSVRLHRRAVSTQTMPDSDPLETCLLTLPESERLPALTKLLQVVLARSSTDVPVTIPDDFLTLTLRAMTHLKQTGRSNVLYGLAKGLGQMRTDGTDSRFPALRMPMGLLEYAVSFFNSESMNQVYKCSLCIVDIRTPGVTIIGILGLCVSV